MPVYAVEVEETRYTTVLVEADSPEAAEADADEVAQDSEGWDSDGFDVVGVTEHAPQPGDVVWTGGSDGEWVEVEG